MLSSKTIFAVLGSVSPESSLSSMLWVAWFAAFGGVVVIVGLWLEHHGEKDWYGDISQFRRGKSMARWGWRILMLGLVIETVVAFAFSIRGELHERDTRISAAKNDPLNEPVSDVSADVMLVLKGTNFDERASPFPPVIAWMNLHESESNLFVTGLGEFSSLESEHFRHWIEDGHPAYFMQFHSAYMNRVFFREVGIPPLSAGQLLKGARVVLVFAGMLPNNSEVLSGNVQILINGRIPKQFSILPQKSFIVRRPWVHTNEIESGFRFIASNSIPLNITPLQN